MLPPGIVCDEGGVRRCDDEEIVDKGEDAVAVFAGKMEERRVWGVIC